jgi:hypothetical protein
LSEEEHEENKQKNKTMFLLVMRLVIVVSNFINVQQTIALLLTTPKEN